MKKLALTLALCAASCAVHKPMDPRLIPLATDSELASEYVAVTYGTKLYDPLYIDKLEQSRFAILDELCSRWGVDREAANEVTRGVVSVGISERAVVAAWGQPLSTTPTEGGATWHYRMMAGQEPRRVVFRAGIVSEVYPPGGY